MNCKVCIFYNQLQTYGNGKCYRYPPTPIATLRGSTSFMSMDVQTVYPEVNANGWCGEYKLKDVGNEKEEENKLETVYQDVLSTWAISNS